MNKMIDKCLKDRVATNRVKLFLLYSVCSGLWFALLLAAGYLILQTVAAPKQLFSLLLLMHLSILGLYFLFSNATRIEKAFQFLLLNGSLVLVLAFLEMPAFLSIVDYRLVFGVRMQPLENPMNELDRDLLHIHKPHSSMLGITTGDLAYLCEKEDINRYEYNVRYDHRGFRNDRDYREADCIVIGDSFLDVGYIADRDLLTTKLAESIDRVVVNLGQS